LKIFVCEFITSGGLYRAGIPESLAKEGCMMRDAMLADLGQIAGVEVICCHDARFPKPVAGQVVEVEGTEDVWHLWQSTMKQADAVWAVAPETGGLLSRLNSLAFAEGKLLLGCTPAITAIAASKFETSRLLHGFGISVVATERAHAWLQRMPLRETAATGWVIKPDDGVSCDDTVCLESAEAAAAWLRNGRESSHVVQPCLSGQAISLSMLCREGHAWLLSCNRQNITLTDGRFAYHGSIVNGAAEYHETLNLLAQQIAAAMPALAGYIGVDVLLEEGDAPRFTVLEINPRLTTSYAGLHAAIGVNPAQLMLQLMLADGDALRNFALPKLDRNNVEVTL